MTGPRKTVTLHPLLTRPGAASAPLFTSNKDDLATVPDGWGFHPPSTPIDAEFREGVAVFRGVLIGAVLSAPFWVAVTTIWTLR